MKHVILVAFALLSGANSASALGVTITSPAEGTSVSGVVTITGTSQGLVSGRVAVSIDGGAFQTAAGLDPWSFSWDTSPAANGFHTIIARARETLAGPAEFDTVSVNVLNTVPAVAITYPTEGATIVGTLVVTGSSSNVAAVSLQVDGGVFQPANGLNSWSVVIEEGVLGPGAHTLTARGEDGLGGEVFDTVSVTASDPSPGTQTITYVSSVDGTAMALKLYIPVGFNPNGPPVGLVCHLHGGGGVGVISSDMQQELDARGWIGIAPDGRAWGLAGLGCTWATSAAYVDNPDPNVGPGERDILDAIDWAVSSLPIDTTRVYLTGFSMGGRGTYTIGLRNPDRFAAIAPMGPASDMFEIYTRRPEPCLCKEGMVGGKPGDSPFVDSMYKITSSRFLIENAYNLPVFHAHGTLDNTAANNMTNLNTPYWHGWHMTTDTTWAGTFTTPTTNAQWLNSCYTGPDSNLPFTFSFGHTPTLTELQGRHPGAYDWGYMFTPIDHNTDPKWLHGTPITAGHFGVEDPLTPGNLLGIYDFFERHTLVGSPETIVYKSFTDTHRKAYWAEIDIAGPWTGVPGAIRASRDTAANRIGVELARVATATFDLRLAGLSLQPGETLTIPIAPLNEPEYDPALQAPGEPLTPTIVVRDDFSTVTGVSALLDGVPVPANLVTLTASEIRVGPVDASAGGTLVILANSAVAGVDESGASSSFAFRIEGPNPVSASRGLNLAIEVPTAAWVRIGFYDVAGRRLATLHDGSVPAGRHALIFPRQALNVVASGVYFVRMTSGSFHTSRSVVVLLH